MRFAILAAAAALSFAVPAQAASYIEYVFQTGEMTGTRSNSTTNKLEEFTTSGLLFTYILPMTAFFESNFSSGPTSLDFVNSGGFFGMAGGMTRASATDSSLTFYAQAQSSTIFANSITINACVPAAQEFITVFAQPQCGTVSFSQSGHNGGQRSTGALMAMSAREVDGPPNRLLGFSAGAAFAVPEPTTWAMMISGFGLIGAGMRKRQAIVTASVV